jgi:hypothetical protein
MSTYYIQIITPIGTFDGKPFDGGDGNLEEARKLVGSSFEMESFALENASGELHVFGTALMKNSVFAIKNID